MAYTAWSVIFGETPSAAKWNILGTNDAGLRDGSNILLNNNQPIQGLNAAAATKNLINKNASDQTTIGENNVRVTRYVGLDPEVLVLNTSNAETTFTDLDLTANTSARAFAASIQISFNAAAVGRDALLRKNGSSSTGMGPRSQVAGTTVRAMLIVPLDTGQVLEYKASNANDTLALNLVGYFEYVD